jgi:L-iditol 2-dehydrogenase
VSVPAFSRVAAVAAYHAPLELLTVRIPSLSAGAALLRVEAATLCGTDVHRWQGHRSAVVPPFVPGHETCGSIVATGGDVSDILGMPLSLGDRVIAAYPHCGQCYFCAVEGQANLCEHTVPFGLSKPEELLGGCSEYHYIPRGATFIRVPDSVASDLAASAACALRTVMHGFDLLGPVKPHETVLVLGAGPLGLYSVAAARDRGARDVFVIGAPNLRLDVARAWGASDVLNLEEVPDVDARVQWVRERTSGRGADILFQCANAPALLDAFEMVRRGGRLINIGVQAGPPLSINPGVFFRQVRMSSVVMAQAHHFYDAIEFLRTRADRFDFSRILSNTYSLDRVSEALLAMAEFREVKPVIVPA